MSELLSKTGQKPQEPLYFNPNQEPLAVYQNLGRLAIRTDIPSSIPEFRWYPECQIRYPESVVRALSLIYQEYNNAFSQLVEENRKWSSDYQYATNPNIGAINYFVQIDMAGLTPEFLEWAKSAPPEELIPELKARIFEIENSLAMYNFMRGIFQRGEEPSYFRERFDGALEDLRRRFNRPVALLAVTNLKYLHMLATEFGVEEAIRLVEKIKKGEISEEQASEIASQITPSSELVMERSGFDMFFGPDQFINYLRETGGCGCLLYTRTSLPVAALRKPELRRQLRIPLLEDSRIREIIKANAIMFNIDNPERYRESPINPHGIINDTKAYMVPMGLAFLSTSSDQLNTDDFYKWLGERHPNPQEALIHGKPLVLSYGAYGHVKGPNNRNFRNELQKNIFQRGPYVIQPEIMTPVVVNETDGQAYHFIDRNFFYCDPGGNFCFLGGLRNLMPTNIFEREKLKVHGNQKAVWVEIVSDEK